MKVLETIREEANEGFLALIGKNVTLFCMNYIYTGKLVGVNDVQIKLGEAKIVYETGAFTEKKWKDAQTLGADLYVRVSSVESYTVLDKA